MSIMFGGSLITTLTKEVFSSLTVIYDQNIKVFTSSIQHSIKNLHLCSMKIKINIYLMSQ